MANNLIQIKRSATTATPGSLNAGELAFSNVTGGSGVLFIGSTDGGTVVPIGGVRNPGTLTANQALVANSTSGIDKIITANLVPKQIYANGGVGSAGYILASGASGNVYWLDPGTLSTNPAGSNQQVQFNDSGAFGATANLIFDKATSTLKTPYVETGTIYFANGIATIDYANYTGTAYSANNSTYVGGNTASDLNTYADNKAANAYSNATSYADNKAANAYSNATSYADNKAANAYSNATSYADTVAGNAYTNATSYADNKAANAYSNATSYADTVAGTAYSNATSYADNKAANAYSNATSYADTVAGNAYSNAMADTLSRNATYTGNNIFAGDVTVQGNTVLGNNFGLDVVTFVATVNSNIMPAANVTYNIGNNALRWNEIHASNVHSVTGYFEGNVEVGGDIIVTGNLVTQNVQSVIISDPLIYLAGNNYVSDLVDIGFTGNYYDGSTQRHTGVIRHAATDEYYIFKNLTQELDGNNVVNINDSSFRLADVNAWLKSGGLISNSTAVTITANSSINVSFTANSLTLTTALAATSGGTGQNTYTTGDLLYASTSSALSKLSVGSNGQVLQIVNNLPAYDSLDGGSF